MVNSWIIGVKSPQCILPRKILMIVSEPIIYLGNRLTLENPINGVRAKTGTSMLHCVKSIPCIPLENSRTVFLHVQPNINSIFNYITIISSISNCYKPRTLMHLLIFQEALMFCIDALNNNISASAFLISWKP